MRALLQDTACILVRRAPNATHCGLFSRQISCCTMASTTTPAPVTALFAPLPPPVLLPHAPIHTGDVITCGPALEMAVDGICGRARALTLRMPHGPLRTPVFMPVGTQGTIKGITTTELQMPPLDCEIILSNTYHLGYRPGGDRLEKLGGLHQFMGWPRNILTDSGGFQMVSLLALAEITEEGVTFASPVDGSKMLLTPEESMGLQNQIGSDIMMALDDVVDSKTVNDDRFREACYRTLRWIDRCISAHGRPKDQNLFGIVQGGLDVSPGGLRDVCLAGMMERDASLPGYAIGGLAGGEDKEYFWRVVDHCTKHLPPGKPCYLMGVGYPLDIVICTALGVDMYDCVYPTRTARFGTALVHSGLLKLKAGSMASDMRPVDETCPCYVCRNYTRAYLHVLMKDDEANGPLLLTYHNIAYMMRLVREMRAAVLAGTYPDYVRAFVANMFPDAATVPPWVVKACTAAGFDVTVAAAHAPTVALFESTPVANHVPSATPHMGVTRGAEATPAGVGSASASASGEAAARVVVPMRGEGASGKGKEPGGGQAGKKRRHSERSALEAGTPVGEDELATSSGPGTAE